MNDSLTDKQRAWLERYLACLNATEAARGVYDTEDYATLRLLGSQNLSQPHIRAEIDRRLKELLPDRAAPRDGLSFARAHAFRFAWQALSYAD